MYATWPGGGPFCGKKMINELGWLNRQCKYRFTRPALAMCHLYETSEPVCVCVCKQWQHFSWSAPHTNTHTVYRKIGWLKNFPHFLLVSFWLGEAAVQVLLSIVWDFFHPDRLQPIWISITTHTRFQVACSAKVLGQNIFPTLRKNSAAFLLWFWTKLNRAWATL